MVKKRKAKNQGGAGDMDMGDVAAPSAATFSAGAAKDVAAAGFSAASAAVGGADASGEAGGPIAGGNAMDTSETMGFTVIKASAESARSTPALPAIRLQKATLSAKATLSLASSADSVQLHAPSVLINLMLLNSPSHTDIHQPSPHTDMLDLVR
ncbi:unnamed protein product [Closterium sp. Naga37s-1]|nr:unnamed protein product [Closterium sp. Naga37s-1]